MNLEIHIQAGYYWRIFTAFCRQNYISKYYSFCYFILNALLSPKGILLKLSFLMVVV